LADAGRSLHVAFASEEDLRREYTSNIANGGIFIGTNVGFEMRERVCVVVALDWRNEQVELEGEIVHVVTPDLAGAAGQPGVAVQFSVSTSDLRERFEAILGADAIEDERKKGTGRRRARRAPARVPVLVSGGDGRELEGRSLDLSTSGVLVALRDTPPPVGESVQLVVANPATDEEMELDGEVMRHVAPPAATGAVAVGVRFDVRPGDREEVERFLHSVQVAEHSRRLGGITGPISEVGIENLLQMFGSCVAQGTLALFDGRDEGFIMFEQGALRAAELGGSFGRKALARMLEWRDGSFEFRSTTDPAHYRGDPIPLDAAIFDALRLFDEGRRPEQETLADGARLRIDVQKLEGARAELSQAEEAILDLAQVDMTVGKVIDVIPEPDVEVRKQIIGLLARGLISLEE